MRISLTDGETISSLVEQGVDVKAYQRQLEEWCIKLYAARLNIDYYPTNFVVQNGLIYYVDYECNDYMDQWNFENWGKQYWL